MKCALRILAPLCIGLAWSVQGRPFGLTQYSSALPSNSILSVVAKDGLNSRSVTTASSVLAGGGGGVTTTSTASSSTPTQVSDSSLETDMKLQLDEEQDEEQEDAILVNEQNDQEETTEATEDFVLETTQQQQESEEQQEQETTSTTPAEPTNRRRLQLPPWLSWFHRKDKCHKESARTIAKSLKNRNSVNLRRKVLHASFGIFFAGLNHCIPKPQFVQGMAVLTGSTLLMELLRYRKGFGWMNEILHVCLGSSLRKHEMQGKFTGSFYFFGGVTCTAALYSKPCATLGICQLALADPSASYFGRQTRHIYWSRIQNGLGGFGRNKGILGFLGGALFCVPFNYRILSIAKQASSTQSLMMASLALGLAGAFADLAVPTPAWTMPKTVLGVRVPPFHVDDNFVVPIVSGYACSKVFQAMGWPQDLELARFIVLR